MKNVFNCDYKSYGIDIRRNYTDILILLNTKEKFDSFLEYFAGRICDVGIEDRKINGENYFPPAIYNERAKVLEFDYNFMVQSLALWARDVCKIDNYYDIVDVFKYSLTYGLSKPKRALTFLVVNVLAIHLYATTVGRYTKYGADSFLSNIFCIPIVYENVNSGKKVQYCGVTIWMKKFDDVLENSKYKDCFYETTSGIDFKQIAYGVSQAKDIWQDERNAVLYMTDIAI